MIICGEDARQPAAGSPQQADHKFQIYLPAVGCALPAGYEVLMEIGRLESKEHFLQDLRCIPRQIKVHGYPTHEEWPARTHDHG